MGNLFYRYLFLNRDEYKPNILYLKYINTFMSSKRHSRLNKSMDTLFHRESENDCRVCKEPVVDGRWNYCSERCRRIALSVQKMFIWDVVRDKVLNRDNYACQKCGWSKPEHKEKLTEKQHAGNMDEHKKLMEEERNLEVDHITRLADGGHPLDETNLQTLCDECHMEKTAEENKNSAQAESISLDKYMKEN